MQVLISVSWWSSQTLVSEESIGCGDSRVRLHWLSIVALSDPLSWTIFGSECNIGATWLVLSIEFSRASSPILGAIGVSCAESGRKCNN